MTKSDKFSAKVVMVGLWAAAVSPLLSFVKLTAFSLVGSTHGFHLLIGGIFCQLYNSWRWFLKQDYESRFSKSIEYKKNILFSSGEPLICILVCLDVLNTITDKHPV